MVKKTYFHNTIYKNLNLVVNKGDFIVITGANGSGKSTIIKMILRQSKTTSGEIKVQTKKIFYIPESINLPGDVKVIAFIKAYLKYLKVKNPDLEKALVKFKLQEHQKKAIKKLSKGTKQKILLLIADLYRPELLILDEVISGLDKEIQDLMIKTVGDFVEQKSTVILVTHFDQLYNNIKNIRKLRIQDQDLVDNE